MPAERIEVKVPAPAPHQVLAFGLVGSSAHSILPGVSHGSEEDPNACAETQVGAVRGDVPSSSGLRPLETEPTDGDPMDTDRTDTAHDDAAQQLPVVPPPEDVTLLGTGGMGVIHSAYDHALGRLVAKKTIRREAEAAGNTWAGFVNEARVTGQLQHPNIAPVYSLAADDDGAPYFTMQVIEGRSLRTWLREPDHALDKPERLERGLEVVLRVCDALAYAHSRGVMHRDVKPDNIMVGPHGRVYLVDWGVALDIEAGKRARQAMAGTLQYMAPEAARHDFIDEGVDVFGLGAVLYEVLTGKPPYGSGIDVPLRASTGRVIPVRTALADRFAPPRLCEVVSKAIAPLRADRYESVEALRADLYGCIRGGQHLPRRVARAGEVIVRQGDDADCAYLITEGRCVVTQKTASAEITVRHMGPGEVFGELAVLLNDPRTATVTAETDTTLLVIDRAALQQQGVLDGWSSVLLEALAQRFRALEREVRGC